MFAIMHFFIIFIAFLLTNKDQSYYFSTYLNIISIFCQFSTFRGNLLTESEIGKIDLVAEFLGSPRGCQIPQPDNIFFQIDPFGPGGWMSERIKRSIKEPYVFAYAHRRRISIHLY